MKNLSKDFENTLIYFNSKTLHTISPTDLYVFPENSWTKKKKRYLGRRTSGDSFRPICEQTSFNC